MSQNSLPRRAAGMLMNLTLEDQEWPYYRPFFEALSQCVSALAEIEFADRGLNHDAAMEQRDAGYSDSGILTLKPKDDAELEAAMRGE